MTPTAQPSLKPPVVWQRTVWKLAMNPFPSNAIASLGREDMRENGGLFRPEVQQRHFEEAIDKFVLGAAYSGLKFGYLWSTAAGRDNDYRGYGKSSLLQYLVEHVNEDWGRKFLIERGLDEDDADESPVCALLASFDMGINRSLAAVFFQATHFACRFHRPDGQTLATRLRDRLVERLGTDETSQLEAAVEDVYANLMGQTLGPPNRDFVHVLCAGDQEQLGRFVDDVRSGARARVGAANFLATFLLFAKAAGVPRVLLGCDQLEDFASTNTAKQKRGLETERFRDFVVETQPMADMLTVIVTMHPRAERAISEMWRLADLPSLAYDRAENEGYIVVLEEIQTIEQARDLLLPYLEHARKPGADAARPLYPLDENVVEVLLDRAGGKPRDILRKAHALVERGARENWEIIDRVRAANVLDSLDVRDDDALGITPASGSMEEQW